MSRGALALSVVVVAGGTALAGARLERAQGVEADRLGALVGALVRRRARATGAQESGR